MWRAPSVVIMVHLLTNVELQITNDENTKVELTSDGLPNNKYRNSHLGLTTDNEQMI